MAVDKEIPITDIEEENEKPSKTYRLDIDTGRIFGKIDSIDAVNQAIRKAIITQRFCNLIYDSDYGCEASAAVHDKGVSPEYIQAAVPEMVKDALSQDSRILDVFDFVFSFENDEVYISFKADTIFGETEITVEV